MQLFSVPYRWVSPLLPFKTTCSLVHKWQKKSIVSSDANSVLGPTSYSCLECRYQGFPVCMGAEMGDKKVNKI